MLALIKWPRRHGSLTKASSSFPQRTRESDRPIRAGRRDTRSAVITALRGEGPAGRRRAGAPSGSISRQPGSAPAGPVFSPNSPRTDASKNSDQSNTRRAPVHRSDPDRLLVWDRRSSSLVARRGSPLSSQGRSLWEKLCDSILFEHESWRGSTGVGVGWGWKSRFQSQ